MAITPQRLIAGVELTNAWAIYYTVPSTMLSATAKQLVVCNTDTVARTFYYAVVVPPDTAPVAKNTMFSSVTLQSNESKIFGLTDIMAVGTTIQAKAGQLNTTTGMSITVSGMVNT